VRVVVPVVDEGADGGDQLLDGGEGAAADGLPGDDGELTAAVAALRDGYGFGVAGRSLAAPISSRIRAAPTVSGGDSL
jgi:hypothetical protein